MAELSSLVDPPVASPSPTLPVGHPFTGVQSFVSYWSASTSAGNPAFAWNVVFFNGNVFSDSKTITSHYAWCVRGPMQESVY